MNFFSIPVSSDITSYDLFQEVQKYIHMIELYHLNLKLNFADVGDDDESEGEDHDDYTIRDLLDAHFSLDK